MRLILPLLLLAGCAPHYADLQSSPPLHTFATDRTPTEFAGCMTPALMNAWGEMVRSFPDGESQVVGIANGPGFFFTVTATPDGRVVVRQTMGRTFDKDLALVRGCL